MNSLYIIYYPCEEIVLITSRGLPLRINYLRLTIDSIKQRFASVTIDYLLVTTYYLRLTTY